jgi:hypothetical protein
MDTSPWNSRTSSSSSSPSASWRRNNNDDLTSVMRSSTALHEHHHGEGLFSSHSTKVSSPSVQIENLLQSIQALQIAETSQAANKVVVLEKRIQDLKSMLAPWDSRDSREREVVENVSDHSRGRSASLDELDVKHLIGGNLFDEVVEEKKVVCVDEHSVSGSAEERNELKRNHFVLPKKKTTPVVAVSSEEGSGFLNSSAPSFAAVALSGGLNQKSFQPKAPKTARYASVVAQESNAMLSPAVFNDGLPGNASNVVSASRNEVKQDSSASKLHSKRKAGYVCHLCKAVGEHKIHECPERFQIQKAGKKFVCKLCHGPHIVYKCPQFKHSVPSAGYICKICGEDGDHWFYNCPHK